MILVQNSISTHLIYKAYDKNTTYKGDQMWRAVNCSYAWYFKNSNPWTSIYKNNKCATRLLYIYDHSRGAYSSA